MPGSARVLSVAVLGIVMMSSFSQQLSFRRTAMNLEPRIVREVEIQSVRLAGIEIP